jgi:hypothetical protein
MSLVPYGLRPRYLIRSFVLRRGVVHPNALVRPIAMLMVGQTELLRVKALRQGLVLGNPFWRAIGAALLVRHVGRSVLHKEPEHLTRERLRAGHFVNVAVTAPRLDLSRSARRAELKRLETDARASISSYKPPS